MANIKSAKKRINTINRQKAENKLIKSTLSTYIKKFKILLTAGEIEKAEVQLKETISYIDSACSKGILHKNNAARKVGRLSAALFKAKKSAPAKVEEKKVEEKKAEVKVEEKVEEKPAKKTTKKAVKTEEKPAKKVTKTEEEKPAKKATKKVAKTEEEKPVKKTTRKATKKEEK